MSPLTVFSIGLNVGNTEPAEQFTITLELAHMCGRVLQVSEGRAQWQGVPERFLQIAMIPRHFHYSTAAIMARVLRQDAVALWCRPWRAWELVGRANGISPGSTLIEFPLLEEILPCLQ